MKVMLNMEELYKIKQTIRLRVNKRLDLFDLRQKLLANKKIKGVILKSVEVKEAKVICIYQSMKTEVDTKGIIKEFLRQGKKIVVPVNGPIPRLTEFQMENVITKSQKELNYRNEGRDYNLEEVDVFICPGVAFDKEGNRLGRGGGYYDRLLAGTNRFKIGLAYSCQIVDKLVQMSHDVPMDMVITEKSLY